MPSKKGMAGAQPTSTRPNILILMVDQLSAAALPGYGHRLVKSPNIDAIMRARNGVSITATPTSRCVLRPDLPS